MSYEYRSRPAPIDPDEPHNRAKFAYYRECEATINAGPAKATYTPAPSRDRRAPVAECGTPSGFSKHVREGTQPDQACRDANNLYQRAYRARKCAA